MSEDVIHKSHFEACGACEDRASRHMLGPNCAEANPVLSPGVTLDELVPGLAAANAEREERE